MPKFIPVTGLADHEEAYLFHCPGCNAPHEIIVRGGAFTYQWNGKRDSPTVTPSVIATEEGPRCHAFISDGKMQFLADCDHEMRCQRIEIPEWPESVVAVP